MHRLLILLLLALPAGPAFACDCMRFSKESPHFEADADRVVESATVIAEGVIERPLGPLLEPAVFRPTRVLRGPRRETYAVGVISDCGLLLREPEIRIGLPVRLVLTGGPELFEAGRCVNPQSPDLDEALTRRLGKGCRDR